MKEKDVDSPISPQSSVSSTTTASSSPFEKEESDLKLSPALPSTSKSSITISTINTKLPASSSLSTSSSSIAVAKENSTVKGGESRLFQAHRTIGLVTTCHPYTVSSGTSSLDTFVTVPLLERFVIYKCDSLQPVLVSDCLPSSTSSGRGGVEQMHHVVSDSSLSITLATHSSSTRATHATLYKRTKIVSKKAITSTSSKSWGIVHVVNLGKSKFPKETVAAKEEEEEGNEEDEEKKEEVKMENRMIVAFICATIPPDTVDDDVEIIGDSDDDESLDSENNNNDNTSDTLSSRSDEEEEQQEYHGEVVIVLASRSTITIHKRIPLDILPNFVPSIAVHPHTYLNKILIGSTMGQMILLNIRTGKVIYELQCLKQQNEESRKITALEQSPAVDTIGVGTACGKVHLVNIRMDTKLFTLYHNQKKKGEPLNNYHYDSTNEYGSITSLSFRTDSSALEYGIAPLAVGQMNGTISIWDLSPEDDDDDIQPSSKRRTLLCQMANAHPGGVSRLSYFAQEPLLLSSGYKSNSLLMHLFDNPNHSGRILRQRVGHIAPPRLIRYQYSSDGILASMADGTDAASCQILSCGGGDGDTSLRVFSTARSVLDREYSQGKGLVKKARQLGLERVDLHLNEITGLSIRETRSRDWGDLVTIHKDHAIAYVWSTKRKAQSGPVLKQQHWNVSKMKVQPSTSAHATSVALSSCGNFALVGTKGGVIYKYNIESGLSRGSYPPDDNDTEKAKRKTRRGGAAGNINRTTKMLERSLKIHKLHNNNEMLKDGLSEKTLRRLDMAQHKDAAVTGLAVDSINKTLVSVGSDGKLILWSFTTHLPHKNSPIQLSAPAIKMINSRDSGLVAVALNDFSVIMFDCSALTIVRRFGQLGSKARHDGPITDLAFSPDGRKLFTSSLDGTLRIWDVPTNTCVDWLSFERTPMSLTLSSTGEFLATSHLGRLGISLWCDRSFYQTVQLDGAKPPSEPSQMNEPASVVEDTNDNVFGGRRLHQITMNKQKSLHHSREEPIDVDVREVPVPKHEGLVTLSGLPAAQWKNLFRLELVKERNKPKEAPKKPPNAPFFLQWRGGESVMGPKNNIAKDDTEETKIGIAKEKDVDDDEWEAAWSDEDDNQQKIENAQDSLDVTPKRKRHENSHTESKILNHSSESSSNIIKRKKVTHFRSELASLLLNCSQTIEASSNCTNKFEPVTDYIVSIGPAAIDVAFSTLCHGMHDLDEGLHLLHLATQWLLGACKSREKYEAVNSYLHRFLHLHATTIAGIDMLEAKNEKLQEHRKEENNYLMDRNDLINSIAELRFVQKVGTQKLRDKMKHTLCLLQHFSRII